MFINPKIEFTSEEKRLELIEKYGMSRESVELHNTLNSISVGAFYTITPNLPHFVIGQKIEEYFDTSEFGINNYGVCDTPDQVLENQGLIESNRQFFVAFFKVIKMHEPENGGWRWHKWGTYIGTQIPTTEYIFDEPIIEEVLVYQIYEIIEEN